MHAGEPGFEIRLDQALRTDGDLPDEVGYALRRAAERMYQVSANGQELLDEEGPVEMVAGPIIHNGAAVIYLDTDGFGFRPDMIETMARVLVEELAPLEVDAQISATAAFAAGEVPEWRSSEERGEA